MYFFRLLADALVRVPCAVRNPIRFIYVMEAGDPRRRKHGAGIVKLRVGSRRRLVIDVNHRMSDFALADQIGHGAFGRVLDEFFRRSTQVPVRMPAAVRKPLFFICVAETGNPRRRNHCAGIGRNRDVRWSPDTLSLSHVRLQRHYSGNEQQRGNSGPKQDCPRDSFVIFSCKPVQAPAPFLPPESFLCFGTRSDPDAVNT